MFWQIMSLGDNASFYIRVINGMVGSPTESFLFWVIVFIGVLFSVAIHEYAHARSAYLLGDTTAFQEGRMNINPANHFDIFGFLLLLLAPFSYGKPVPVNPGNFRNPVQGMMYVSLSGPASNLLQAVIYGMLFIVLKHLPASESFLTTLIYSLPMIGLINLNLMVFNLLPIYPLDGSKIWGYLSPAIDDFIHNVIAPNSWLILILLIFPIFGFSILSLILNPFASIYFTVLGW